MPEDLTVFRLAVRPENRHQCLVLHFARLGLVISESFTAKTASEAANRGPSLVVFMQIIAKAAKQNVGQKQRFLALRWQKMVG